MTVSTWSLAAATPAAIADLAVWLRDHDVRLGELRGGRRTLEEVFLRLTGSGGRERHDDEGQSARRRGSRCS